jgi:hypothetical protein
MLLLQADVCALRDIVNFIFVSGEITMLAIRIYISALTLLFLSVVIASRGLGLLQAVVITCAIVYLILDVRTDLQASKLELNWLCTKSTQMHL